ncbi:TIGR01906 family membrane protein [Vagococcus fluvialis]|uniref:TIGR01906 family membrane protein n=1 Tax=Vagococcus fluvialis TaxID=2738 RepID=UPI0037BAFF70
MGRVANFFKVICLLLFLLTVAITITINSKWLYTFDIQQLNILDYLTVTKEELLKNYSELMRYLNLFWVNPLKMTDFPVSESGAFHFYEVKRLFQLNYVVLVLTLFPSLWILYKGIKEKSLWKFIRPFSYVLVGLFSLIIFMSVAFDTFFVTFHGVFFNNDAWIFDPTTDPIILALPEEYFMHCFILFFVIFVFLISLIVFLGKRQFKKEL